MMNHVYVTSKYGSKTNLNEDKRILVIFNDVKINRLIA